MQKLTVQEYAKLTGVSSTIVYRKIKRGELATKTEVINNRELTVILLDDQEKKTLETVSNNFEQKASNSLEQFQTHVDTLQGNDFIQKMYEDNMALVQDMKKYIELAGQTKLLEDSEKRTQDQYFELLHENKTLLKETSAQAREIDILKEQLKKQEEKILELQKDVDENKKELIQKAHVEAGSKIKDVEINELKEKIKLLEDELKQLKEKKNFWQVLNNPNKL